MNIRKNLLGATMATTVALTFAAAPVTLALAHSNSKVECFGVNSCKGQSACKTLSNSCKGQNSCKGKGFLLKSKSGCLKAGGSETDPAATNNNAQTTGMTTGTYNNGANPNATGMTTGTNNNGANTSATGMGSSQ